MKKFLYKGVVYREDTQFRELMALIRADIRSDREKGLHIDIGEDHDRRIRAEHAYDDAQEAILCPYYGLAKHFRAKGLDSSYYDDLVAEWRETREANRRIIINRPMAEGARSAPEREAAEAVVPVLQQRREKPTLPARERIITEAVDLDRTRIARRKRSRLPEEVK
jgi:hypothetical protein